MIDGFATMDGTKRLLDSLNVLQRETPWFYSSPIALGTHLGDMTEEDSLLYRQSIQHALTNGINFIDTAINYRGMRSERDVGIVLKSLFDQGEISREEIVISTKAGIIPGDVEIGLVPKEYLRKILLDPGIINESDLNIVEHHRHVMNPSYYDFAITESKKHLGLNTIDIHYIHNPEISMMVLGPETFYKQLEVLIIFYEEQVDKGNIRFYGLAVWSAFLQDVGEPGYISLDEVMRIARGVAGDQHHFRFIQLPYNMSRQEANTSRNQKVKESWKTTLSAAHEMEVFVTTSAPFNLGKLVSDETSPHDQLTKIMKTKGILSTMVGMKNIANVRKNLETIRGI